jgi:hypothetical protein
VEGFDNDQFQTSWRGCDSVDRDRNPGNCAAGCPGTRLAGVLREPGCWIQLEPDGKCNGVGTQPPICERASEAHFSEAQDVSGPHQQVGAQAAAKAVRPTAFSIGHAATIRSIKGEKYARLGTALLLCIQQD